MQVASGAYSRALSWPNMSPVYLMIMDGVPTRFSTGPVTEALGPTKQYLMVPTGTGQQITPDEGRSSISSISLSVLDKNGEVTYLNFQYEMANRGVVVKMGFQGMPEEAWATVFRGRILTYKAENGNAFWTYSTTDLQRVTKQDVFTALTKVSAPVLAADVTVNVGNAAAFATQTSGQFYVKIDDEVIAYTGTTGTSFTGCTRGELGTVAADHDVDAEVKNLVVLEGNPLNIALWILTSTGTGANGSYDVLPASCGLGIPVEQINVQRFERERERWTKSLVFRFEEFDKVEAKTFLQEQIYTFIPAYPVVDSVGRISMKVAGPPLPTDITTVTPLNDDNLIERPSFTGNVLDRYFFNELDLSYDYDFRTGVFGNRTIYEDAASQETFDQVKTRTMQSRGIRASIMQQSKIDNFGLRFLQRYSTPAPILSARGFLQTRMLEVGDVVPLSSATLPNLKTGKIGVRAQLMEIISAEPKYSAGGVTFLLLNTPYSFGRRYAAISPSAKPPINFPVYSAATPTQKNYAFISTKVNATRGIMLNGDDGYYITT